MSEIDFEEGRFQRGGFPLNRGKLLRIRAYSKALLTNLLPTHDLIQASSDYEQWATACTGRKWDSQAQADYLSSVRMALIASDQRRFAELLKIKRSFESHQEEFASYQMMAVELTQSTLFENIALKQRFHELFDIYRNPNFKPDVYLEINLARFEMGIIWCKYFFPLSEFAWQEVADSVSA